MGNEFFAIHKIHGLPLLQTAVAKLDNFQRKAGEESIFLNKLSPYFGKQRSFANDFRVRIAIVKMFGTLVNYSAYGYFLPVCKQAPVTKKVYRNKIKSFFKELIRNICSVLNNTATGYYSHVARL
jgi:hypothetical protein